MPTPMPIPRNQFLARLEAAAPETEAFRVRIPDRALPGSGPGALRAPATVINGGVAVDDSNSVYGFVPGEATSGCPRAASVY